MDHFQRVVLRLHLHSFLPVLGLSPWVLLLSYFRRGFVSVSVSVSSSPLLLGQIPVHS